MDSLRVAPLLCLAALAGCAADDGAFAAEVDFRVLTAPGDEPFAGGSSLVVALEGASQDTVDAIEFPVTATSGRAPVVPEGEGYRFRVDVLTADGIVLGRGRSFPFDVTLGEPPATRPDVLLLTLGRFVSPIPVEEPRPSDRVSLLAPTSGGALLTTTDGRLYEYVAHAHDRDHDGEASLRVLAAAPGRRGASWAHLGEGLLLAVGGERDGATLYDRQGREVATLDAPLGPQRHEPAVVAVPGRREALVVGGSDMPAGLGTDRITRIEATEAGGGWTLSAEALPRGLVTARRGAGVVAVPVDDAAAACPCARILVVGGEGEGGWLPDAELVDPAGVDPPSTLVLGTATRGAALVAVDLGLALVAGGRGTDGRVVDEVRAVDVRPGAASVVSPAPPPLTTARAGAAAARFAKGLVVVVGGVGADDLPLASAELYDFEAERFGESAATGALPRAQPAPRAIPLADGTVLSADSAGLAVYAPPRGSGLSAATAGAP